MLFFLERRLKLEEVYIFFTFCLLEEGDRKNGVGHRRRSGKEFEARWRHFLIESVEITK